MSSIVLGDNTVVSEYAKPYIIAEVNSSHNGDIDAAKRLIDAAVEAGCDCVKFQSWSSKTLYSKSYYNENPIAKRFVDKFSLSPDELKQMSDYCAANGIAFSSTPYSREEVDFLTDECHVPFVKVASMEINNPEYIKYIAEKQIPIVISTGMSDYGEVQRAIKTIESAGNKKIAILHCVALYPTPLQNANINNMFALRDLFPDYPIGFSDHTLGDTAAVIAAAIGAAIIEKHITLDSKTIGMDNQMAMEPEAFKILVEKCAKVPDVLGVRERVFLPEELKQRTVMRRSIVTTRDLKSGDIIQEGDLGAKRPGTGFAPEDIPALIGKKLKRDVSADMILSSMDIE